MLKPSLRVLVMVLLGLSGVVLRGQSTKNDPSAAGAGSPGASADAAVSAESGLVLTSGVAVVPVWLSLAAVATAESASEPVVWDAAKDEANRPRPKLDPKLGEPPPPPAKPVEPEADVAPGEALKRKN